jgi:sorbitol/mannitol transport system permease protein
VKGIAGLRMLIISPFFVMPAVSALVWKNLLMNPVSGLFAAILTALGLPPVDWLGAMPLASIIAIVSWEWLPFATLIFLTSLQSLDREQMEAAELDGAKFPSVLRWLILPHLARPIAIVVLMETIFLLAVFAEIYVTTGGGPGDATTNLSFLIFAQALLRFDIGAASAGGIVAVIIANILAVLMVRIVGKSIEE